jgi:hypothetical protein
LEKHTVSIFRAEVVTLGSGMIHIELEEGDVEERANQRRGMRGRKFWAMLRP